MKKCPYCSEEIQDEAIKCRYCGEFLDKPAVEETETDPVSNEADTEHWRQFSEEYGKAGDPHKRRLWNALNREQRDYVSLQFGVAEPPPPKKKKFGILTYGCLTSIALLVVFSIVFDSLKDKDPPKRNNTQQASSPAPRVKKGPPKHFLYAKSAANIREGPGKNHPVVWKTRPGEKLEYVSRAFEWYKLVPDGTRTDRYIHESVVVTEAEKTARESMPLALLAWSWHENYGYAVAEGKVKNASSKTLENVEVVVEYMTAGGDFITSDSTLIEYTTLLPGQTSPFKSMARWNPAMKKANIGFKTLFGTQLGAYQE